MSWSVSAAGTPPEVRGRMSEQFKSLVDPQTGLSDEGERKTVQRVHELIEEALGTFADDVQINVLANGHLGYADWTNKTGGYQSVSVQINPWNPPQTL